MFWQLIAGAESRFIASIATYRVIVDPRKQHIAPLRSRSGQDDTFIQSL
jgi:hypothetical protein